MDGGDTQWIKGKKEMKVSGREGTSLVLFEMDDYMLGFCFIYLTHCWVLDNFATFSETFLARVTTSSVRLRKLAKECSEDGILPARRSKIPIGSSSLLPDDEPMHDETVVSTTVRISFISSILEAIANENDSVADRVC